MWWYKLALVILVCAGLAAPCVPAAAQSPAASSAALAAIGAYAKEALVEQGAPGMSVAITDRTHTLLIDPVGYANLAAQTPVTASTRFGIGSITKSFTSTALLELRDEGRFNPQLPITTYLPWFRVRSAYRPITGHDLFTHTSGLPDGGLSTGLSSIYLLRNWYTGFAPGTHWSYSNVGYDTLGAVLETLDHADYPSIVQRRVLRPLQMNDTTAIWSPQTLEDAATGYLYRADDHPVPEHPELVPAATTNYVDPAGSILTTPSDMAKYMRYLLDGGVGPDGKRLLSPSSFALLTSPSVTDSHELGSANEKSMFHHYGYGLAIMNVNGDKVLAHTGGVLDFTACMEVDVTAGFGVVAMSNLGYVGPRPCAIVRYALAVLRAQSSGKPLPPAPVAPDPLYVKGAAQYAGTYRGEDGGRFTVSVQGGNHLQFDDGSGRVSLYPRGTDSFWVDSPRYAQYLLQFGRETSKRVDEAFYGPNWYTSAAYTGPRSFNYPKAWNAYIGHYQSTDANGYFGSVRVFVRKGRLVLDDGMQLVPLGGALFRVGSKAWSPERFLFDEFVDGYAQRIRTPGDDYYRT